MRIVGGVLVALVSVMATYLLVGAASQNLPGPSSRVVLGGLIAVAALTGFICGSAIVQRASYDRHHIGLFSGMALAVCGGLLGTAYALALTVQYLGAYTSWPQDKLDQILILLAYPVFAAVGLCLGAVVGLFVGLLVGGMLRLAGPGR